MQSHGLWHNAMKHRFKRFYKFHRRGAGLSWEREVELLPCKFWSTSRGWLGAHSSKIIKCKSIVVARKTFSSECCSWSDKSNENYFLSLSRGEEKCAGKVDCWHFSSPYNWYCYYMCSSSKCAWNAYTREPTFPELYHCRRLLFCASFPIGKRVTMMELMSTRCRVPLIRRYSVWYTSLIWMKIKYEIELVHSRSEFSLFFCVWCKINISWLDSL